MCFTKFLYKILKFKTKQLTIDKKIITVFIADSSFKKMLGLMHRKSLGKNEGMLFIFGRSSKYGIWMLNMNFNIDILWLDGNFKITDILKNAKPCKSMLHCKTYYPKNSSKYVLEVNSGFVVANKINISSNIVLI